jgi:hypothetical protein
MIGLLPVDCQGEPCATNFSLSSQAVWVDKLKFVGQGAGLDAGFKLHYCLPDQWSVSPHADSQLIRHKERIS